MPTDPLGRGLESLIPDRAPDEDPAVSDFTKDTPESERKPVSEVPKEPVLSQAVSARTYQDHFVPRRGESPQGSARARLFWLREAAARLR